MRRALSILVFCLTINAIAAAGDDSLPSSFRKWSDLSGATSFTPQNLDQIAGPNARILREYGVVGAEQRIYVRGSARLTVHLYRMRDASAAFGAYTFLLDEKMAPADLSRFASISSERALVVVGDQVLEITGNVGVSSPGDLKELLSQVAPARGPHLYPTMGEYFPDRGRVRNSERYIAGPQALSALLPLEGSDWLGFNNGAEAQLARYRLNGKELTLLLALYPTPQVARQKLQDFLNWMAKSAEAPRPVESPRLVGVQRKRSLLALVVAKNSSPEASALLEQVRYEIQVTWNEPNHTLNDPTLSEIIVGSIVGTGVFLLLAFAAGMGFGGLRLLVKKLLPGKVFDRPERLEIIQLGLSSKPIEAKDFYRL